MGNSNRKETIEENKNAISSIGLQGKDFTFSSKEKREKAEEIQQGQIKLGENQAVEKALEVMYHSAMNVVIPNQEKTSKNK